jgi:hypothetical protein
MARAERTHRARILVLSSLTLASIVASQDAEAQRRRRRRRTDTQQTATQGAPQQGATTQGTAQSEGDDDEAATTSSAASTSASAPGASASASSSAAATAAPSVTSSAATASSSASNPGAERASPVGPERPRPAAIDLRIGFGVVGRSFWYTDDLFMVLRPYYLPIAPAVNASVEWYPGAHFSRGVASMFGLVAEGGYTLVFSSPDAQRRNYPTTAFNAAAGLRTRLWLLDRIDVGLLLGFAMQSFTLDRSSVMLAPAEGIANTTYLGLRAGITGRVQIVPRLAATVGYTFQYVLDSGEFSSSTFFPRATVMAMDWSLGAAFAFTPSIELRLSADWRRYFSSINPMPGDLFIAGGSVDDNYGITASFAFRR